ncbi:MAG: glycosyltransferase family 2 protein [Candidatus Omnitrophica bacterium]|nr:glycosyltransferase family 2 protein [Candidatus Omnitrophota bacterium]MBU0877981.1 glycosyltransferase family 2 protein [Candidatus Omnitrophota bacterium]MBU0897173.1 glycosyltransferase family 2 protein [Candidatus Omnitrophota bacterium]MBU1134121.1 glycosyltransferase family 2 protein [Candidatus Omnitrophota bacterium]MBU1810102.1 glycosyltransferase family 2 protein [Candidatus Omnitrophota bacterium]
MKNVVTVAVINYNGKRYLDELLRSISEACNYKTIVVDNGSEDGSVDFIKENYPQVDVIALGKNYGHSRACNVGLEEAKTKWVCLLDHDVVVTRGWIEALLRIAKERPDGGIFTSRVVYYHDKKTIHSDGGYVHYIGHLISKNNFFSILEVESKVCEVDVMGSTSILVDKGKAEKIGLFDEDFFIGYNDFEFSFRMKFNGYKCLSIPQSVVYHKVGTPKFSYRGGSKYPKMAAYYMLRNRWIIILKFYSLKTIVLCSPAFLFYEMVVFLTILKRGFLKEYANAIYWIIRNFRLIYSKRKTLQSKRKFKDRELLRVGKLTFTPGVVSNSVERIGKTILDNFLIGYWKMIRIFLS